MISLPYLPPKSRTPAAGPATRKTVAVLFAFLALGWTGCAPSGFVETTVNVIDESTAFKNARKANSRAAWDDFIRRYPQSSKAKQAKQWVAMMPERRPEPKRQEESRSESSAGQAGLRQLLQQQAAQQQALQQAAQQAEAKRKLEAESQRLKQEQEAQRAKVEEAKALEQQQPTGQTAIILARLQKLEEDLARREAALKQKELDLAAQPPPAKANDDVDIVPAGGLPPSDDNFAIVIGIEKYRDIGTDATYAEKDARTVLAYLRDYMGYPEQNIIHLSGDHANQTDIAKWVEKWLPLQVTAESKVFIYFSGHGSPDPKGKQAYLVPHDGDPKMLEFTGYSLEKLYAKLGELPAKEVTVVLDSCFSGAGGRSVIAAGARPLMTKLEIGNVSAKGNLTVFSAAAADEITLGNDPQKHGLFTYYFLRGLRGDADADQNGSVSVQEQYDYVKKNVSITARRDAREQTPQLLPSVAQMGTKAQRQFSKASK